MEILVKIFATALALSQVTTTPDALKTQFDRGRDQEQVAQLLRAVNPHDDSDVLAKASVSAQFWLTR
jgi:hypothetical protein